MRIMQTLGRHGGAQEGVFMYKRGTAGVTIDPSISRVAGGANPRQAVSLTTDEWNRILAAIENAPLQTFRITVPGAGAAAQPNQSIHQIVGVAVPTPAGGWTWDDSYKSCVAAILEHEGSLDLYHGVLGAGNPPAIIELRRDIP